LEAQYKKKLTPYHQAYQSTELGTFATWNHTNFAA
jgi:hypothetical protein